MDHMIMEIAVFFVAQSVIIIGAMLTAYIKLRVALAKCEIGVQHVEATTTRIEANHKDLSEKVDGISHHVSAIEGKLA